MKEVVNLLLKDWKIELRRIHTLAGILLFVGIVVYLLYKSFNRLTGMEWNVLIWIVMLFASVNAVAKSFSQENSGSRLYYFTTVHPTHFFIGKLVYNFFFIVLLFLVVFSGFSFFMGNPVKEPFIYLVAALLGLFGIAVLMTLISAVSGDSESGGSLMMSILSLPLTIPILLLLIKLGAGSMHLIQDTDYATDLWMLAGIDAVLLGLALLLFNEVWKN